MPEPLPSRILVPIDVGDPRRRPFEMAVQLAELNGATVLLLAVIDDSFPYPDIFSFHSPNEDYYRSLRDRALEFLKELASEAPSTLEVDMIVSRGKPARVIVEVAEEENIDLIIMRTRGTRGFEHAVLGSVADKVLRLTPCPILIIPEPGPRPKDRRDR